MNTTTSENGTTETNARAPRRPDAGERARVLAEWAANGRSVKEMAAATGFSTHTLYRWRHEAGRRRRVALPARPALIAVPKPATSWGIWAAEVEIGTGLKLRLSAGCPPGWTGQVVRELRSCSA